MFRYGYWEGRVSFGSKSQLVMNRTLNFDKKIRAATERDDPSLIYKKR